MSAAAEKEPGRGGVILAIDPGTTQSGWVRFDGRRVLESGVLGNSYLLARIAASVDDVLAIEQIEAMGMAVGRETFETVHWSGRFHQAWRQPDSVRRVTRRQVKLGLCGSMRAKDPNIRQALIDMLGEPGVKARPGPTYGVVSHAWAALAVAVIAAGADSLPRPFERAPVQPRAPQDLAAEKLPF